jgi:hemerythrin-like domain-containing protein
MDSLEILREEHRVALRVAHAARRRAEEALRRGDLDTDAADRTLDFFRYFTNSCHSPKEEDLLFTALHHQGLSWDEPPLRGLVEQHEELRVVLDSATDWLRLVDAGAPGALEPLLHDLRLYLDLLERHVNAEEQVLFPLALERLRPRDLEELGDAFSEIACEEAEEGIHEYYAGVARRLAGAAA